MCLQVCLWAAAKPAMSGNSLYPGRIGRNVSLKTRVTPCAAQCRPRPQGGQYRAAGVFGQIKHPDSRIAVRRVLISGTSAVKLAA
jgi:hypothetical protein